jgi:hypothetical protein
VETEKREVEEEKHKKREEKKLSRDEDDGMWIERWWDESESEAAGEVWNASWGEKNLKKNIIESRNNFPTLTAVIAS